jgi:hypothetical protein
MTVEQIQRFTLLLAALVTAAIVVLDALLWASFGADATFSRAFDSGFRRWPITTAVLLFWIGLLVGHLLPARP